MAIHPDTHQPTGVLGTVDGSAKKRNRPTHQRPRSNSESSFSSSDSSSSSSSSEGSGSSSSTSSSSSSRSPRPALTTTSSTDKPKKSRTRNRQRKNKSKGNNNDKAHKQQKQKGGGGAVVSLSQEQRNLYVAMDCEMVGIGVDGLESALARVTVVGWDGDVILDEYALPPGPVTDYRTFVSGITPANLVGAISVEACRTKVAEVLEGRILVGHALKNDLSALGLHHPWYLTRDTAKYEPFMRVREYDGLACPRKLRDLAHHCLERDIQIPGRPHCPYEDALTALDLYKSVREKWELVMEYKISRTRQIEMQQQQCQLQQQQQAPAAVAV